MPVTQRDVVGGTLLIVGSLASILVLSFHPTSHDLLSAENFAKYALVNRTVHGVALAAIPTVFLGLVRLSRRLGLTDLTTAALVAYGFGGTAIMSAAVASGFVATGVFEQLLATGDGIHMTPYSQAAGEASNVYHALALYTGLMNQGFAKVSVVASSVAILLFSAAVLKSRQMSRAAGVAGLVVGAGVLVAFLSGRLSLDVHGFGIVTYAQSGWLIWLGILLCREGGALTPV